MLWNEGKVTNNDFTNLSLLLMAGYNAPGSPLKGNGWDPANINSSGDGWDSLAIFDWTGHVNPSVRWAI
jgi:hypothetical protein